MSLPLEEIELDTVRTTPPSIPQQSTPPPSRSNTAQAVPEELVNNSSSSWWQFWNNRVPSKDRFETYLDEKSSNAKTTNLSHDYSQIKLFNLKRDARYSPFSCNIFRQAASRPPSNPQIPVVDEEELPFGKYLDTLRSQLKDEEESCGLRTW